MQQLEELPQLNELNPEDANRVVHTLMAPGTYSESVAEIAHDARNMVTALHLYCDLLDEPGVLTPTFAHYGGELRLVAAASRRLIEKLVALEPGLPVGTGLPAVGDDAATEGMVRNWKTVPIHPITNLAEELLANRHLLASLAGPTIALSVDVQGGAVPVRMTAEDLTRIVVNLVRNAAEAMSAVGRIHLSLRESCSAAGDTPTVTLNVEDNGPGLGDKVLETIFEPRSSLPPAENDSARIHWTDQWPVAHRGLGLSITRSIVEAAGGEIHAANRDPVGACFQIELPISKSLKRNVLSSTQSTVIWPTHPE